MAIDYSKLSDDEFDKIMGDKVLNGQELTPEEDAESNRRTIAREDINRFNKLKSVYQGLDDNQIKQLQNKVGHERSGAQSSDFLQAAFSPEIQNQYKEMAYKNSIPKFQDALKNARGWDKEGNLILGDDNTGEYQALDKNDFADLYKYANDNFDKKNSFENYYADKQARELTKDKQYLGSDTSGNSVFKNNQGIIERAKGDFSAGLQRMFGEKQFNKTSEGINNQVANENVERTNNPARTTNINLLNRPTTTPAEQAASPENRFQQFQTAMQQGLKDQFKDKEPTPLDNNPEPEVKQARQVQSPPSAGDIAKSYASQQVQDAKQSATNVLKSTINQETKDATKPVVQVLEKAAQPYIQQAQSYLPPEAQGYYNQVKTMQSFVSNPQQALRDYGNTQATDFTKSLMSSYGANDNTQNVGANVLSSILQGGNITQNLTNMAKNQAEEQAKTAFVNNLSNATPGEVQAALQAGKVLTGGGNAESKGDAAGRAAALAAASAATGGLSNVINPETMQLAAGLQNKLKNSGFVRDLGIAGAPLKGALGLTSGTLNAGANAGNELLNLAGKTGSQFFGSANNTLKGAKDVIKNITAGNVGDALKGIGSTALKSITSNLVTTPVNLIGDAIHSAGKILGSLNPFCFAPGTKILMKDGTYKKIEKLKIGDEISLGGAITAIGQAVGTQFVVIKDVHVIESHALFEDGRWIRAKDSKNITDSYTKEDGLVYPIATENHLVVTEDQIWSDTFEHDEQNDMTRDEIINDLNNDEKLNKLLQDYLRVKEWK